MDNEEKRDGNQSRSDRDQTRSGHNNARSERNQARNPRNQNPRPPAPVRPYPPRTRTGRTSKDRGFDWELAAACLKTALRVLFAVMLIIGPAAAACTAFRYHYDRIMAASTEERQAIYDAGSVVANPWHLAEMMGLDRNDWTTVLFNAFSVQTWLGMEPKPVPPEPAYVPAKGPPALEFGVPFWIGGLTVRANETVFAISIKATYGPPPCRAAEAEGYENGISNATYRDGAYRVDIRVERREGWIEKRADWSFYRKLYLNLSPALSTDPPASYEDLPWNSKKAHTYTFKLTVTSWGEVVGEYEIKADIRFTRNIYTYSEIVNGTWVKVERVSDSLTYEKFDVVPARK
ncbi:MAG: hypothetical protein QXG08_06235 [Candidatus Methanomethyliaceae archaeon]